MNKFIVQSDKGMFLTPRRATGKQYENRSGWSKNIEDAKIFQNKAAATNSANKNGSTEYIVRAVKIVLCE